MSSPGAALWATALLTLGVGVTSAEAAEIPATIDPNAPCVTSECHSKFRSYAEVHWSDFDAVGECQKCHEPVGNAHKFDTDDSVDHCLSCHEDLAKKIAGAETVHDPAGDDCTNCHDPHGGEVEALLIGVKDENLRSLCFECHDEDILQQKYTHGPAEQGECTLCHDPHASSKDSLLIEEPPALCGDCHDEVAEIVEEAEYVHDPAAEDCTDCHDPHSGPYPMMLPAEKRQLCNECHDDVVEEAESAAVDHAPVLTGDECLTCHSPHGSNNEANLLKPPRELCLGCHDKPIESGGETLLDVKSWLSQHKEWHEPIREKGCTACHQPHGSANFRLLAEPYPQDFYSPFSVDAYALCFSCHKDAAVTVQWTRTLTGFRDGNRNLHYFHVDRKERGRTCRACHDPHASSNPLLVREQVPYGKWTMPIDFEKNETGGSCHPGCHKLKHYDRRAKDVSDGN